MLRFALVLLGGAALAFSSGFQSTDFLKLRGVGSVQFSPDGSRIAYSIARSDGPRRPYGQLWIMTIADGKSTCLCTGDEPSSNLEWSPDGKWISYSGRVGGKSGLIVAKSNGGDPKFVAAVEGSNAPLPSTGRSTVWSPDSKRIAYISATPGPETADATGDPAVITRYLYKPTASEGNQHFNDNKRLHIFIVDVASGESRQLSTGVHYEHSLDWSPSGREIVYVSNRAKDDDQYFNYDLFTIDASTGETRQLTSTENAEYRPHYSPDGKSIAYEATKRGLTDRETTMEDTHVWMMDANGKNRRDIGKDLDARQGEPQYSSDGRFIYFTAQERGNVHLYRVSAGGAKPEVVVKERGSVTGFSVHGDLIAYTLSTPGDYAELYLKGADGSAKQLTDLNREVMAGKTVEPVEAFTFISNDNKWIVEAFLTYPADFRADKQYPLIVNIHGGPHGQQGPSFNIKNQIYASHGWATIMINYRGSTGYGQMFADAIFADQNGNEGMDVLYGVNAAIRRYPWIDQNRLGIEGTSYGGQLSAWLITQTHMFKAAIPNAAITNIISYNYMTYYNQYEAMEWGAYPHQGNLMDVLWERSALKHVANVVTPTMLVHGENDADVPIAEAEQYYVALKDVGVETIMVRYPREGHGVRESHHNVDFIDRSIRWYEQHFPKGS
ncbi:MAG TPA: S9 family peptidase [Bryobacteraceae bacterium]|jgi:dipeptidyl aminopeptidase/acylaminoacyl peptidase